MCCIATGWRQIFCFWQQIRVQLRTCWPENAIALRLPLLLVFNEFVYCLCLSGFVLFSKDIRRKSDKQQGDMSATSHVSNRLGCQRLVFLCKQQPVAVTYRQLSTNLLLFMSSMITLCNLYPADMRGICIRRCDYNSINGLLFSK